MPVATCQAHAIRVDIHNNGNRAWVDMRGKQQVTEGQFVCAVYRVMKALRASLVEFDADSRIAKLRLRSRKKLNRMLKLVRRTLNEAFDPRRQRHSLGQHNGHERPRLRQPTYIPSH